MKAPASEVRIDKWLWAARLFRTRALASAAVSGGKVQVNGVRVKPARALRTADLLEIVRDRDQIEVTVVALSERRGGAREAALLYRESEASVQRREAERAARALTSAAAPAPARRPDKRARRELQRWLRGG